MDNENLCLQWSLLLLATALTAFALGMLFAQMNFQITSLFEEMSPAALVPIIFGVGAYGAWLFHVIKLTLATSEERQGRALR